MTPFRCSDAAAERTDPLIGTAPPQRRWLLVEHPGPWPISAPFGTDLPTGLLRRLGHPDLRVLLVRPHGRREPPAARRWFLCQAGTVRTGTWAEPADLLAAVEPGAGTPYDGPLLAVCTHGVHDVCCAVKGRPVAAALSERWPDRTWECSHLGGDRFAASVLVFPDAACYGAIAPEGAVATIEAHLAGRPVLGSLRGVAGLHPAEQVAQAEVLTAIVSARGPVPLTALTASLTAQEGTFAAGRWTVSVTGLASAVVEITSRKGAPTQLTCSAAKVTAATRWTVESVTPG